MKRIAYRASIAIVAAAILAMTTGPAGCGIQPTGIVSAGDPPFAAAPNTNNLLYFVRDGKLTPVVRPGLPGHPALAIEQLSGPTKTERDQGISSEMPHVQLLELGPGEVIVGVDGQLNHRTWPRLARAQLACTAAAIPGVQRVRITSSIDNLTELIISCDQFHDLRG
jgi:hypothetical protein